MRLSLRMETTRVVYSVSNIIILAAALLLNDVVVAELPDQEYGVFKIQQKTECPTIFCPWNCQRYIDGNGCLFCGACAARTACPKVSCPSLPTFGCAPRVGRDGCTMCKCRIRPLPLVRSDPQVISQTERAVLEFPAGAPAGTALKGSCPRAPMCSQNCQIERDANGCERCKCTKRTDCPEAENAPCRRPDCRRELGADGCYHCRCPDDVMVCPDIKCSPCSVVVDKVTGCVTGCNCQNEIQQSV